MRKNLKRVLCSLLILVMAVASLSACGSKKLTAADVMAKSNEVKITSIAGNLGFDVAMSMKYGEGTTLNMTIKGSMATEMLDASKEAHMKGNLELGLGEVGSQKLDMESYTVKDGDAFKEYSKTTGYDKWIYQTKSADDEKKAEEKFMKLLNDKAAQMTMTEEQLNGADCYKLSTSLSSAELKDILGDMSKTDSSASSTFDVNSIPIDGMSSDLNFFVSKDKFEFKKFDFNLKQDPNASTTPSAAPTATPAATDGANALQDALGNVSYSISKGTITFDVTGYNTIDKIELPADVKSNAVDKATAEKEAAQGMSLDDAASDTTQ